MKDILLKNQAVLNECIYLLRCHIDEFNHQLHINFNNAAANSIDLLNDIESTFSKGDPVFAEQTETLECFKDDFSSIFNEGIKHFSIAVYTLCEYTSVDCFSSQLAQYKHFKEVCIVIKNYVTEFVI